MNEIYEIIEACQPAVELLDKYHNHCSIAITGLLFMKSRYEYLLVS